MKKSHIAVFLVFIAAHAVLLRCLHLLNPDHYYIISPDSHFFHWQAERVLCGQSIPLDWHSGLTYPLAYFASIISHVSGLAPADALTLAAKLIPPVLAVVSIFVLYWGTSRMYGARAGIWAAAAWSVFTYTLFVQLSGYLDRDGLSMPLVVSGVFLFYWGNRWHFEVCRRDLGWALGAAATASICALLYLEWVWLGPALLLIIITSSVVAEVLVGFALGLLQTSQVVDSAASLGGVLLTNAVTQLRKSSWRPLALLLGLVAALAAIYPGPSSIYRSIVYNAAEVLSGTAGVAELSRLSADDILRLGFLIIPIALGSYIAISRHRRADLLFLAWAASVTGIGLFVSRVFTYAAPALCVIGGLGLASIFSFRNVNRAPQYIRTDFGLLAAPSRRSFKIGGAVLLLLLLLVTSTSAAYIRSSSRATTADNAWQGALAYLNENTPPDSVVMSWWDYGYWILDMAGRRPVVDNGFYGWDDERLADVGLVYCTNDPSEAAHIMRKYGARYVVFPRKDIALLPVIAQYGLGEAYGDGSSIPPELEESLFQRTLSGDLTNEAGLTRIYPAPDVKAPDVAILALN